MPFPAVIDLSTLDGATGIRFDGVAFDDRSGASISWAGDVNGDGYDDIIIGADFADPGGDSRAGSSYVVFGGASGFSASFDLSTLDGSNGFRLDGIDINDLSGRSVSSAGDVNGDGLDDIIIGAQGGNSNAGESYVVFGNATGFAAALDLASLDGTNGFRVNGITPNDRSGVSVASAGDVNGDGFDDFIVGAYTSSRNGRFLSGESYVVFGTGSGFAASLDLSTLDGTNGFLITDSDSYERQGISVSSAGDVNGDGFDDIIVGAYLADSPSLGDVGESYVVFGKATGFNASINVGSLDGVDGFSITGIDSSDLSGRSVSSAGDVNGDGFDDIIIGAYFADPGGDSAAGESYVVFGKASGFAANILLSSLDGTNGFRINGIDPDDASGRSVSGAGDVNGDGFDDIIIGAPNADPDGIPGAGESYVVFGKASGFTADLELSDLDGTNGFRIDGIDSSDSSGRAVAGVGDFNGDGFGDILVGASRAESGGLIDSGESYVIFGIRPLTDEVRIGAAADQRILGGAGNDTLLGQGGDDFLRGDDGNDLLFGGNENDTLSGGAGDDTLDGGESDDSLNGGVGIDSLSGGLGDDTYRIADASETIVELLDQGFDTVRSSADYALGNHVERLILVGAARNGTGNTLDNMLFGTGGGDTLSGLDGNDVLRGQGSRDTLLGGDGDDTLDGGQGKDTMTGGAGRDMFLFRFASDLNPTRGTADVITDFDQSLDERINLSALDADTGTGENDDFSWISTNAFSGSAGELRYQQARGDTYIEGDINGDGLADFTIKLEGLLTLDHEDFQGVGIFP